MFGFRPRPPVSEQQRLWVDGGITRLAAIIGRDRMFQSTVVLPTDEFFPDCFDGSLDSVRTMAARIAGYMGVAADRYTVELFADEEDRWRERLPTGKSRSKGAAGYYMHAAEGPHLIALHARQIQQPVALAATLAHELAHVVLLGDGLLPREEEDMELMTDLCTVFLGLGVLNASAAFQFQQWQDNRLQGWSTSTLGYLTEELWGYALARFAQLRGEPRPRWSESLPTNVRAYMRQSERWLARQQA
ncbi:hypothetical protein SAMN05421819_2337 [Bryocella elongata]|uniref:Uncharacterized protein n=1 Tax=Bryocella elongata TaxID=863522 RepID=A0A1H5YJR3_9BACT|nr:hypothetical protein [Bryocella elongata]SEG23932.1 hypothetical protein SAMN05421819_2337 [Bryocella elongata]